MTVSSNARKAGPFTGDGVATEFPFAFTALSTSDIAVYLRSNGSESLLVEGSDYVITLNLDQDATPGGSITTVTPGPGGSLPATPLPAGDQLYVIGCRTTQQDTAIKTAGALPLRTAEATFDSVVVILQQLEERIGRALVKSVTDPTDMVALFALLKQVGVTAQISVNGDSVGSPKTLVSLAFSGDGLTSSFSDGAGAIEFVYSGVFRPDPWDMSSGAFAPATPATDYQSSHTDTTITPDAHLTGAGSFKLAAATSGVIPILTSGTAQASITNPGYVSGDTIYTTSLFIANSAITAQDIETFLNGTPVPGVWLAGVTIAGFLGKVQLSVFNNGTGDTPAYVDTAVGDTLFLGLDYATGAVTMRIGSNTYGPATLNLGDIPAGQDLHLIAGVISTSADVVFAAGHISVNFSDTSDPPGSFVFTDTSGGATLSDGGATVTFPSATGHAVNNGIAAFSGKVAIPFRLNSDLPDGATVNVGLQVSPNYADWVWNGAVALIEYHDPGPNANLVLNDHNVSCARSGEFCLLVDIDARTSSIIIPGGATVLGSTSPAAACGFPVVELASGTYAGGITLLTSSSYSLPSGYVVITG